MLTNSRLKSAPLLLALWGLLVHVPLSLYLMNQGELYYQSLLLLPGLILFLLFGTLAYRLSPSVRATSVWARPLGFLIGFGILATHVFYINDLNILNAIAWLNPALLLILFGDKVFQIASRPVATKICASLFLAIVATDIGMFFTKRQSPPPQTYTKAEKANNGRGNVYHILFDMYQTDDWLPLVAPERTQTMTGFTLFENHLSVFDYTQFSVPALFSSRLPDNFETVEAFQDASYLSPDSLLGVLDNAGYRLEALNYRFPLPKDRGRTRFDDTLAATSVNPGTLFFDRIFYRLVFGRTAPVLFERPTQRTQVAPRVHWAGESKVVADLQAFDRYLNDEAQRTETGRYSFLHVMLPHHPYILDENCRHVPFYTSTTRAQQSECAAKLIDRFVARLKELNRYDSSTIVIHSDHGYLYPEFAKERLERTFEGTQANENDRALISAMSALLLYKPRSAKGPLQRDLDWRTSLDVAPTLVADIELAIPKSWEGQTLTTPSPASRELAFYRERRDGTQLFRFPKYRFQNRNIIQEGYVSLKREAGDTHVAQRPTKSHEHF